MDWITEYIAIGNNIDAQNLKCGEFDAVLCLVEDCCDEDDDRFDVINIPLMDSGGNSRVAIKKAIEFIDDVVSHNEKILVHCHAGRSRSVCIVARYLMFKQRISSQEALELIEEKREIYLSPGIEEILNIQI